MSLKPICVPCQRFFRPKKNGREFIEGKPTLTNAAPGTLSPSLWKPYKIWMGDEWECQGCKATIIVGTGREPISEHYHPNFPAELERLGPDPLQVNDC